MERAAEVLRPQWERFIAAKREAETLFQQLREADLDECVEHIKANPPTPEAIGVLIYVAHHQLGKEERSKAGKSRQEKDPVLRAKAEAKAEAKKLWQERRDGKHPKLRTNEQFAIECMRHWPVLTSSQVICRWCAQWGKDAKAKSTQLAE